MPKASEVASEFRRLADGLDGIGEAEVEKPLVSFYSHNRKETFLALIPALPRPLSKKVTLGEYGEMILENNTDAVWFRALVYRSVVCKMVKPAQDAEYECEPLLSQMEQEEVEANVAS